MQAEGVKHSPERCPAAGVYFLGRVGQLHRLKRHILRGSKKKPGNKSGNKMNGALKINIKNNDLFMFFCSFHRTKSAKRNTSQQASPSAIRAQGLFCCPFCT
jgi:hypothetical protein